MKLPKELEGTQLTEQEEQAVHHFMTRYMNNEAFEIPNAVRTVFANIPENVIESYKSCQKDYFCNMSKISDILTDEFFSDDELALNDNEVIISSDTNLKPHKILYEEMASSFSTTFTVPDEEDPDAGSPVLMVPVPFDEMGSFYVPMQYFNEVYEEKISVPNSYFFDSSEENYASDQSQADFEAVLRFGEKTEEAYWETWEEEKAVFNYNILNYISEKKITDEEQKYLEEECENLKKVVEKVAQKSYNEEMHNKLIWDHNIQQTMVSRIDEALLRNSIDYKTK